MLQLTYGEIRMLGRERVKKVMALIGQLFPDAHGELTYQTPFQLLIAVILSAQATDNTGYTPGGSL